MNKTIIALSLGGLTALTAAVVTSVNAQTSLPPVTITYTYPGSVPKDVALIADALTALVKPKINATIKLEPVDWGAYDQKRNLALAAGERCDIMFTAPWTNNYGKNVNQGNLLPLDDLLKQYAPKLFASFAPATWNAARIDGKIYGVINHQAFPASWGFWALKPYATKYNLNVSAIRSYADLEPFLRAVKNGEGFAPVFLDNSGNNSTFHPQMYGFDQLVENLIAVRYDDPNLRAFSMLGSTQFRQAATLSRRWNQAGYFPKDLASESDVDALKKASKGAVALNQWRPDSETQFRGRYGGEIVGKSLSIPILSTGAITATMNGICKSSANPERAMMFLELLNSDPVVYNTLAKGIEGKHWVFKDKARNIIGLPNGVTTETNPYSPGTDWMFGSIFNAYPNSADAIQEAKDSLAQNKSSRPSTALGFNFDQEPVKSELAQINSIYKEFALPLLWGQVDPGQGVPELQRRLNGAGMVKVVAEVQKQLNAWKAKR